MKYYLSLNKMAIEADRRENYTSGKKVKKRKKGGERALKEEKKKNIVR